MEQNQEQQQNDKNTQQESQITAEILSEEFLEKISKQLDDKQTKEFEESDIQYKIVGLIDSECRYFPSKKGDDNDIAFVFIKDEKKKIKEKLQITLQRCRFEKDNQMIFNNFKIMTQMLKEGSIAEFKGNLGRGKNGVAILYAHDYKIYKVQPQYVVAFKWIQLYVHKKIDEETCCVALQINNEDLQEIIKMGKLEKEDVWDKLGSSNVGRDSKSDNKFKMKLVEITRVLQNIPINKCKQRMPKFPRIFYTCIDYYEKKFKNLYEEIFIDQENNQINEDQQNTDQNKILQENLPNQQDQRRIKYINEKKVPQVQWFLKQLKILEQKTINKQFSHIIDIGGGRGDLGLAIAQEFKDSKITVIDINEPSLIAGRELAEKYKIPNIQFKLQDVLTLKQDEQNPYDLAVGLHACGGLSDNLLNFSCINMLNFFVCTCCFNSLYQLVPEQYNNVQMQFYKNKQEDREILGRFSEVHEHYDASERCMKIVNTIRFNTVKKIAEQLEQNQQKQLELQMLRFPVKFSLKNYVLQGLWTNNQNGVN